MKPSDILDLIKKSGVKIVDFRFVDMPGTWRHASMPASALDEERLSAGIAFESDVLLRPDLATAHLDGFRTVPTLSLLCDMFDPVTKAQHAKDSRAIARRAQDYLRSAGIADTANFGPQAEFYIFDSISYENQADAAGFALESGDAPRADRTMDLRSEMALELANWGIDVDTLRHTGSRAGQGAIALRFDSLLRAADNITALKYVVKNVAARGDKIATFMPKPLFGDDGSGMLCHQSLWRDGRPLFYDANGYAECSQTMLYYIGGLLTHVASLLAFAAPTTNSYKRLVPHVVPNKETPVHVAFSTRNRSAAIGIPAPSPGNPKAKRLEFRPSDGSANPYLAFSAMLLAGIDGIRRKIDPVRAGFGPLDRNNNDLPPAEAAKLKSVPGSLRDSLAALAEDHAYLTEGGVFSKAFVDEWIAYKTERELRPVEARPHPFEIELYADC